MDKSEISPDGSETAVNMTLFPPAWKPVAKHRSLTGTERPHPDGEADHAAAQGEQAARGGDLAPGDFG